VKVCGKPVYCLVYFWPWKWKRHVPPKRRLIFNRLQGIISQKLELFKNREGYGSKMALVAKLGM
jgi:hypothetical protein